MVVGAVGLRVVGCGGRGPEGFAVCGAVGGCGGGGAEGLAELHGGQVWGGVLVLGVGVDVRHFG